MDVNSRTLMDYVKLEGAVAAGVATIETLAGGPPSTDLTYVLPSAKAAVSFALPLDQNLIVPFLSKKDRLSHERNNFTTNATTSGIAFHLANLLGQKGIPSVPVAANEVYRPDSPGGRLDMFPDISLRYLAVRSGVGHFGLSGNVITKDYGGAVILGAVVTSAPLEPTAPLPPEDNYCDGCRLCQASCASGLMDPKEMTSVGLGGVDFAYSKRRNYLRCEFVCGGFTGLAPKGEWSTWSPGRFAIPKDDSEFLPAMIKGVQAYHQWPPMDGGHYHVLMREKLYLTCGHCQLICVPDKEERKRRHQALIESGVVVQERDGKLIVTSPERAKELIAAWPEEVRALYTEM